MKSKNKKLIFFIPSIEEGGVEKNLFVVANYLVKKNINVYTVSKATSDYINFTRFDKYTKFHFFENVEPSAMSTDT